MFKINILSSLIGVLCLITLSNCSEKTDEQPNQLRERYYGTYLLNATRKGSWYKSSTGATFFYVYVKATIINDTTIPLRVHINFSDKYYESIPSKEKKFRIFILPETMTTIEKQWTDDGSCLELKNIFEEKLNAPIILDKIIEPHKECIVNIGFLADTKYNIGPNMGLFSAGHKLHYGFFPDSFVTIPDSALKQIKASTTQLNLYLGLNFGFLEARDTLHHYAIITCGQISFPKQ